MLTLSRPISLSNPLKFTSSLYAVVFLFYSCVISDSNTLTDVNFTQIHLLFHSVVYGTEKQISSFYILTQVTIFYFLLKFFLQNLLFFLL